jgi:maltooligosyltrehalose trehalohydrolase
MPGTPMIFQGQEFGATTPFLFFADHKPELAAAVRKGRGEFLSQFPSLATPAMQEQLTAPDDQQTFERSKLDWSQFEEHTGWRRLFADLLTLRSRNVAFTPMTMGMVDGAVLSADALVLRFFADEPANERLLLINLGADLVRTSFAEPLIAPPEGYEWHTQWCSECPEYGGEGVPDVIGPDGWHLTAQSAVVLRPEKSDGGDGAARH